jgi:aspartyl-tRNA(Asn)/glutamyl-tRNA(Gln) amidotransferase subunit A
VSIKDPILTRGWPTLRGSRAVDPNQAWEVDASVTARLCEAGAVLVGKTTTPEFGCKGETNSPLTGITRNSWNTTRTPGGSSGGRQPLSLLASDRSASAPTAPARCASRRRSAATSG